MGDFFSMQLLLVFVILDFAGTEEEGNAPQSGKCHRGVDDTRPKGILTAADPRYKVKFEQSDGTPVQRSDDYEN